MRMVTGEEEEIGDLVTGVWPVFVKSPGEVFGGDMWRPCSSILQHGWRQGAIAFLELFLLSFAPWPVEQPDRTFPVSRQDAFLQEARHVFGGNACGCV